MDRMDNRFICTRISLLFCIFIFEQEIFAQQNQNLKNASLPAPLHLAPDPEFSILNFCLGDTAYFINQTIRNANPSWAVINSTGDTIYTVADTNMSFLFPAMETYTVTLRADNGHIVYKEKTLIVDSVTKADFAFQRCSNRFVNMSSCASGYFWNFGDNSTSANALPIHQYADTGYYNVTLIASNGQLQDTLTQILYVGALGYPGAEFTFIQSYDTVCFYASDSIAEDYSWSFGDNTYGTGRDTMHVYADPGVYEVTLFTQNQCGINFSDPVEIYTSVIEQFIEQFNIAIFPNPASNQITVQGENGILSGANISLQNIMGEKIMKLNNKSNSINLDLSSYSNGIYFLSISTDKGAAVKKIVLNK